MRTDAAPSSCDVVGCDKPVTGSYLRARDTQLLEFGICDAHYVRMQLGDPPQVVADGSALTLTFEHHDPGH